MPTLIQTSPPRAGRRPAERRGFTLVEVMVTLTLTGLVVGTLLSVVVRQQRFAGAAADVLEMRDNLRQIGDLLPMELRGLAAPAGDLIALSDSAIDFRQSTGAAIVCDMNADRTMIVLPPTILSTDAGLTSWITAPVRGDELFVLDPAGALPDTMTRHTVNAAPTTGTCPIGTAFTRTAAEAASGVSVAITPALSPTTPRGAPVRFFRRARYSLYLSPSDGQWYLGYRDFNAARLPQWSAIQPVAGPLLPYASDGTGGLRFQYYDAAGAAVTNSAQAAQVRRIDVIARAQTRSPVRTVGLGRTRNGYIRDSARITIALRNY